MYCNNCGHKLVEGSNYCSDCGQKVKPQSASNSQKDRLTFTVFISLLSFSGLWIPILGAILGIVGLVLTLRTQSNNETITARTVAIVFSVLGLGATLMAFVYWTRIYTGII